jgi:hypothetical protein
MAATTQKTDFKIVSPLWSPKATPLKTDSEKVLDMFVHQVRSGGGKEEITRIKM